MASMAASSDGDASPASSVSVIAQPGRVGQRGMQDGTPLQLRDSFRIH